jgi:hypothetical protein
LIYLAIGMRGAFSQDAAQRAASAFRKTVEQYPQAIILPTIPGFDEDPRELWEFEDVRNYVQLWARFAGLDDFETAERCFTRGLMKDGTSVGGLAMGFLAACRVFGEEVRAQLSAAPRVEQ